MAEKKSTSKKKTTSKKSAKKGSGKSSSKKTSKKETEEERKYPTLKLRTEHDIALDFATKVYKTFKKSVKAVVLFGSTAKKTQTAGSDIDIIIILDDVTIKWDQKLAAWYREELNKIIRNNPYKWGLHINTVKLSTWWEDMLRGDPIVLNIIRHGETLIDLAGFFDPLKNLLFSGKIKSSPEAIYSALQRAPSHLARSYSSVLGSIEGLYWCMVDSAHAALIAERIFPPSPEHIPEKLKENFVSDDRLKPKYVQWFKELKDLHKKISRGHKVDLKGVKADELREKSEEFLDVMAKLVKKIVDESDDYENNNSEEEEDKSE